MSGEEGELVQFLYDIFEGSAGGISKGAVKLRKKALIDSWWMSTLNDYYTSKKREDPRGRPRLAQAFVAFIKNVLYTPTALRLTNTSIQLFGADDALTKLRIPRQWLSSSEEAFVQQRILPNRAKLFSKIHECENGEYHLSGCRLNFGSLDTICKRSVIREFYWSLLALRCRIITDALISAIQYLLYHTEYGGRDLFLTQLHDALQMPTCCDRAAVVCFDVDVYDIQHPDVLRFSTSTKEK